MRDRRIHPFGGHLNRKSLQPGENVSPEINAIERPDASNGNANVAVLGVMEGFAFGAKRGVGKARNALLGNYGSYGSSKSSGLTGRSSWAWMTMNPLRRSCANMA